MKKHFNYQLQVWVLGDRILPCAHPQSMGLNCCNAVLLQNMSEKAVLSVGLETAKANALTTIPKLY